MEMFEELDELVLTPVSAEPLSPLTDVLALKLYAQPDRSAKGGKNSRAKTKNELDFRNRSNPFLNALFL